MDQARPNIALTPEGYASITDLKIWEKNPRSITDDGFDRLKRHIKKFGLFKPLVVTPDGTVIGGNMRYRACLDLGIDSVWVSVVEPKDETEMMEIALADNDRAGFYDADKVANEVLNMDIDWRNYSVDFDEPAPLNDLVKVLTPIDDVVKKKKPKMAKCPHCGKSFEL